MGQVAERIRGRVSPAILDKVNRLFRNDDAGVFVEVLQNARRAGANLVQVHIKEMESMCRITVEDDGSGIENFQNLLTLGASDWNADVHALEDPAGMGFFSLCHSEVEIHSGHRRTILSPEVFLGRGEAAVTEEGELVHGTRIRFTRQSTKARLLAALERVAEFCPLKVAVDEGVLAQHDFLDGAEYREWIDGIEIGIAPGFQWSWSHGDDNWNFYGARIRHPFPCPDGWLTRNNRDEWPRATLHVRFDVRETGAVKLQLPDRRAIVEDDYLRTFQRKALAAVYRFFQSQERHALPFRNWQEAQELGISLPEASCLLTTWHANPQDEFFEPLFGAPETRVVDGTSIVALVEADLANSHTLEAALETGGSVAAELYEEHPAFAGYAWYDKLPRVSDTAIFVDAQPYQEWIKIAQARPTRLDIEIVVHQSGLAERRLVLPAQIHVDSESINEPVFTAITNSPWDNNDLSEPFSMTDFLMWATFSSSDAFGECDSWETQRDEYQEAIERVVNEYFRGPRVALLFLLRQAIPWEAHTYLDELAINEIRLKRGESRGQWDVEIDQPTSRPGGFESYAVADVSTGYLEESDCVLLEQAECPTRLAVTDDLAGTFHWVTEHEQAFDEEMQRAQTFGLSERFRLIMRRLRDAKIRYVRFDADGGEVDGLERADL